MKSFETRAYQEHLIRSGDKEKAMAIKCGSVPSLNSKLESK